MNEQIPPNEPREPRRLCGRRFALALGTKALCDLEPLANHSLINPVEDIRVVVYSLDSEIEYGDAELGQFLRSGGFDFLLDFEPTKLDRWEEADGAGGTAFDAPPGECVDMNVCLVSCGYGNWSTIPFQESLVQSVHVLHEGYLEMQTRLGDRLANGLSKLGDDYLLSLVNRIEGARENQEQEKTNHDNNYC